MFFKKTSLLIITLLKIAKDNSLIFLLFFFEVKLYEC